MLRAQLMRCLLPPSKALAVGSSSPYPPRDSYLHPADVGEGSGDDSGDDERLTKADDDDEDEDDGTVNSPVSHCHSTGIHLSSSLGSMKSVARPQRLSSRRPRKLLGPTRMKMRSLRRSSQNS